MHPQRLVLHSGFCRETPAPFAGAPKVEEQKEPSPGRRDAEGAQGEGSGVDRTKGLFKGSREVWFQGAFQASGGLRARPAGGGGPPNTFPAREQQGREWSLCLPGGPDSPLLCGLGMELFADP